MNYISLIITAVLVALFTSCATITSQNKGGVIDTSAEDNLGGTGTSSGDIKSIAERMSRSIMSVNWPREGVKASIAVLPVENQTRFLVDPKLLQNKLVKDMVNFAQGRVIFLARDNEQEVLKERAKKRSGHYEQGTQGHLAGADYLLKGEMRSLSKSSREGVSDYIVYSFQLIDAETSTILWMDDYETKKVGSVGVVYQ
jgi:penicillin-binding protein activator